MVIDEVGSSRFPRYLVYDIVRFETAEVGKTDFSTRLTCIEKEIVGARNQYILSVSAGGQCFLEQCQFPERPFPERRFPE
jgi:hypothetical protein